VILADTILLIHFAFVVFVVGGQTLIMIGYHRTWRWTAARLFRGTHLACVLYVVIQAWAGKWCPLTILENRLRTASGQSTYQESFIQHWVSRIMYYHAPMWVFTVAYTLFGVLVAVYWVLLNRRNTHGKEENLGRPS